MRRPADQGEENEGEYKLELILKENNIWMKKKKNTKRKTKTKKMKKIAH